jgi:hypothetical protein
MKMFKLFYTTKFWTIWILLGLIGAFIATYILHRENEELNNSLTMYVCSNPKPFAYVTLPNKFSEDDLNNYVEFIEGNTQFINFPGSVIEFNQLVKVVKIDNELGIAKVFVFHNNSSLRNSKKEVHWIWIGYLSEEPCSPINPNKSSE